MAKSKYVDIPAIVQVLGTLYQNPKILDMEDKYHFNIEDFTEDFHKVIFGCINNLFESGVYEMSIGAIEDYLADRPKQMGTFSAHKGAEWIEKIIQVSQPAAFDYYYNRMKKMTLFRMYEAAGLNLDWLYDPNNILDVKKKESQEAYFDNTSISDLAERIDKKIGDIRLKYADNSNDDFVKAGSGLKDLIENFKNTPDVGYPLYGPLINTIFRGARIKKFYLRSASTGVGKTRSMIADACYIGCSYIFDESTHDWISTGAAQPTLFISTEQEEDEIQSMMLAFVSAVEEEKIVTGGYDYEEEQRILYAAKIIEEGKIIIKTLPDFSMTDIENTIKYAIREYDIQYVFHDYIHSSIKILSEIGSKAGVKNLREDNILFLISVKLKDICNQYGVFIMSATQLNGNYTSTDVLDQNVLRGAKAIADKIDAGSIMVAVTKDDIDSLRDVIERGGFSEPAIKVSIYKNRRGRWKDILLWCRAKRGICRIEPMFATDYNYNLIEVPDTKIVFKEQ